MHPDATAGTRRSGWRPQSASALATDGDSTTGTDVQAGDPDNRPTSALAVFCAAESTTDKHRKRSPDREALRQR
ncbi:hypothetical protein D3C78_1500870 [compost metagenome]